MIIVKYFLIIFKYFIKKYKAALLGLEPRITVPETVVLPLHYKAIIDNNYQRVPDENRTHI